MVKRALLGSWLVVATALLAGACSDIAGDERRGEGPGEKVSIDQLPAPVKASASVFHSVPLSRVTSATG